MNELNIKRTTNKIKSLAAAMALALFALAGCQQSADSGDMALAPAVTESAPAAVNGSYITLGFSAAGEQGGADGVSASALPDPAGIVFGKFVLSGTSAQQGIAPVTWACGDGTADASQELADVKVPVTKNAEYTFTLTATTLGGAVYVGVTDPAVTLIDQNVKRLSFSMRFSKAAGEGSAGQKGDANVGLNLPSGGKGGEVNKVTVSLYKLDQNGQKILPPVEGFDEKEVPIEDGKALFETGELDIGAYRADFSLWGGDDSRALLGSWSEDIVIAGGQTSASTLNPAGGAEGDQVDLAYSITYHKNDDETDPADVATPTSFSRNINIKLSDIKAASSRPNYRIHSWYTDELCQQEFTQTHGYSQNLDLYATWDESHAINIPSFDHGSATAKPAGAATGQPAVAGETVTITPTPDDGWATGDITLTALDAGGQALDPQPTGWPKVIGRTTAPKNFVMPDLPYGGTVGVDVVFLQKFTVSFNENKPANAKADSTAKSSGSAAPQTFIDGVAANLTANGFAIVGWTFDGWNTRADGKGTSYANKASFTTHSATTLYAKWKANTNTKYTVKHWQQPASGTTDKSKYSLQKTENKTGTTWAKTVAAKQTYTGFKDPSITQVNIKADGSTVVNLYYDRKSYSISKNVSTGGSVSVASSALYGATVTITITPSTNYSLDSINATGASLSGNGNTRTFTMPAQNVTVNAAFSVDLAKITSNFTIPNGVSVKGELGVDAQISIASGASITLKGVNISEKSGNGLYCPGNATINLAADSNNTIIGKSIGIKIDSGYTVTIQGSGQLYVKGMDGAGIGGGWKGTCGNIVINGGTITAVGNSEKGYGAGIGGGGRCACGYITITGGTIDAQGGTQAAGIGGGQAGKGTGSSCGDITISGATVTARAGSGATYSIGPGTSIDTASATCGNLYIKGSLSAYITDSPYTITP